MSDLAGYVLRPMHKADLESAAEMIDQAAEAVEMILAEGVAKAMSKFNRRATPPNEQDEAKS